MASKRALRRRECERKVAYPSTDAAYTALRRSRIARRAGIGRPLHAYHCQFCGRYHLGHMNRQAFDRMLSSR